jgi:murein DD-endopeptidase MepM/ murein hydrolase activator NlpD
MKTLTYALLITVIISLILVTILSKTDTIEKLKTEINTLNEQNILYKDTIQCQQDYYKSILDSLPLGSPLDTLVISSNFGSRKNRLSQRWEYHPGTDFIADWRDTIYATGHGIIEVSHYNSGYGRTIVIGHVNGYKSRYAHLTRYFVKRGESVKKGDPIGTAGNTGESRGYHLHYEVSRHGKLTDPKNYIRL